MDLQRIESLEIDCEHSFNINDDVIHLKEVKNFTLDTDSISEIPLSFERLETITLNAKELEINSKILDFIIQNQSTLTKVSLSGICFNPFTHLNIMDIATAMQLLTEIDLDYDFSVNDMFGFVGICKKLKKFRFSIDHKSINERILKRIKCKWNLSTEYHGSTMYTILNLITS